MLPVSAPIYAGVVVSAKAPRVGPLSIDDNLRLGAYAHPKGQVAGDLEKIYAMFPILKEKRALPADTLSCGQQQMLGIGRELMGRPKMLLLAELPAFADRGYVLETGAITLTGCGQELISNERAVSDE